MKTTWKLRDWKEGEAVQHLELPSIRMQSLVDAVYGFLKDVVPPDTITVTVSLDVDFACVRPQGKVVTWTVQIPAEADPQGTFKPVDDPVLEIEVEGKNP